MDTIMEHRSIRKFKSTAIEIDKINKMLEAASRGSNTGNMQLYSIVLTTDGALREKLAPCHFNQPCVKEAPMIVTFCIDINRFSLWCNQRDAKPAYDNFQWFVTAGIDTVIAAQNFALEAEFLGLGICYLGTTTYNAEEISDILCLPQGVIPLTTLVVGYPDQDVELTDRLPIDGIAHFDTYKQYTPDNIDQIWSQKEGLDSTKELIRVNECENLAQIFTTKRYTEQNNILFSEKYMNALKKQGFKL